MIFAVAMTFIDQTIVAIAAPELQKDLELSENGLQWIVNGYLLALIGTPKGRVEEVIDEPPGAAG